ncbi:MAG TPA: tetratricopeptide repeat protein, partial [Vicinamibacterales bacterium]
KFVTRHRVAVASALALAIAVVTGVSATVWQARAAERERSRAQREFNAVRGLAQSMMGELHDAVAQLPGSTAAREILLRRGTQYLDALAAEAAGDDALRREVAMGYLRLSSVQGAFGGATLGDTESAAKNLKQAASLLQPLARRPGATPEDRVRLATVLAKQAQLETIAGKKAPLEEARTLLDSLTPDQASTSYALSVRTMVWREIANIQTDAHDYAAAEQSLQHVVDTTEMQMRSTPHNLDASYNLSLAYKNRGAVLELLGRTPEAIALYRKALDLDRGRVALEPGQGHWRLDLSFAEGAIASALLSQGDLDGARDGYERAVNIREGVVRDDQNDDFAKAALARGYDRLGTVHERLGRIGAAIEYRVKALRIYRERLETHPERDYVWRQYADAAFDDVMQSTAALQRAAPAERGQLAAWAIAALDDLQAVQTRWTRGTHAGALPPARDQVQAQRALIAATR